MSYNPFSLQNKTILITGASSGIGKATAIECSKLGAKVIITARNQERLTETYSKLEGEGHLHVIADLSDVNQINTLISQLPQLDGLVNNAGIAKTVPVSFINEEKLSEITSVNMASPILLLSKLIKSKKIKNGASVVFSSSINGTSVGVAGSSMYSATKGALSGFVKTAAIELAQKKIRVNCVCPGMIDTHIMSDGQITEEQFKADTERYLFKRYGKTEEVAWSIIYLLSDASSFVTGSNLVIDGGYSIQ